MEKKIKVLHVIGKRPKGGIGTFLVNITKYIDKERFQFDFLIHGDAISGDFDNKMIALGANVYVLPELEYKSSLSYIKLLNEFYKSNNHYNIVHVHSPNIAFFNYLMIRKYPQIKLAVHSHSTKYSDRISSSIRNYFLHIPVKVISDIRFACNIASSEFLFGKKLTENGQVKIIKNGIEVGKFKFDKEIREKIREALEIDESLVIGHVGAFVPVKNHSFIVDIFSEIIKINSRAILMLIGDGELEESIKQKVTVLGIDNSVKFLGRRHDVNELLQALDIFLMPSKFEGMPLVGIEAQTSGLTCFFSNSISMEIKISDSVFFMGLEETTVKWAERIVEQAHKLRGNSGRKEIFKIIVENGFDIFEAVKELESAYWEYF